MGAPEDASAVADAGPLIHLAEIGSLSLLGVFAAVYVPDAVWKEAVLPGRVVEKDLSQAGFVKRSTLIPADVDAFVHQHVLDHLQRGECETLCLYLTRPRMRPG